MTCMLSSGIVCASQDSAAFIESLRDQSDMLRRQATVPEFLQQPVPGKHNDAWIQRLTRKSQQASARSKKTPRALYFLSFSIPEDGL
ncbi:type-F conjugative transfer system pilin assembly protein TrbC, partial [Escherichia sp. 11.1597]|nr:type-F conjugative transfer system pilin assembly protein TrbC [Escherichia sp. 11.1597]